MHTILPFAFPESIVRLISTWLLYSLGAGVLLGLLTSMVMLATRGSAARLRYNLLLGSLALFAGMMLAILAVGIYQLPDTPVAAGGVATATGAASAGVVTAHPAPLTFMELLMRQVEQYSFPIVTIWMLFAGLRSIRLVAGLCTIRRLKTRQNEPAPAAWQQKLRLLSAQLGVSVKSTLLYSHAVTVPMVIGHFKPVILLPFAFVSSLPAAQVEAILLHELAHIARRDYLVNLLVSIMETIFFFNPALIWTASLLRKERENCCDDIALAQLDNPRDYIEALVNCQQLQQEAPLFATALFEKPGQLLGRVKRMVNHNNKRSLNNMEKSILSISLVTAGMLALAFTAPGDPVNNATVNLTKCPENAGVFQPDYWNRQFSATDTVPAPPPPPA
ncbi:MAG: M56 family metallopeptidase, partial [Chitinophagaceae bacterium]